MRSARDNGLLNEENGKLIAINLGADYCSEHEWGIKRLRSSFGMSDDGYGLAKRTATKIPAEAFFRDTDNETVLIVGVHGLSGPEKIKLEHFYLRRGKHNENKLLTSWDEGSFGINAAETKDREAVRAIHDAIMQQNFCMWLGGGGVFQNAGLVLAIKDAIPADTAQIIHDADVDKEKLTKAGEVTGIAEKLAKAGKRYHALSPKWVKGFEPQGNKPKTKHPVMFWLNPTEQQIHNFGWYTVEELESWAKNEGPCMMSEEQKKKRS